MITDDQMFDRPEQELTVVRAVHEAMRSRFREIGKLYADRRRLKADKFKDEADRWGRAFAGAMTVDQFRKLLCDLFRRGGLNNELQERWQELLPMLRPSTWQNARDLALIGICSYQPRGESKTDSEQTELA
jgi:CRISPR-associated protein Cas8a1/Csx13